MSSSPSEGPKRRAKTGTSAIQQSLAGSVGVFFGLLNQAGACHSKESAQKSYDGRSTLLAWLGQGVTPERHASDDAYDGIPYDELAFEEIDWSEAAAHIRNRSTRKDRPGEIDLEPDWATEAIFDPKRVVGDSRSRSGQSIKVIGYSKSAGRLLIVLLVPKSYPPDGDWWGASAWVANEQHEREYQRRG